MPKKKPQPDKFLKLSWDDINLWAGGKIASRGKSYQRNGHVSKLAITADGGLIAWVAGTRRYATRVRMDADGLLESECTCPYALDCKHGVAVVLEYLQQIERNKRIPKVKPDDERIELLEEPEDDDWDDDPDDDEAGIADELRRDIDAFLKGKTKAHLIELIHELADAFPELAQELADRQQLTTGNATALVARLRREIRDIGDVPGWQSHWSDEGFTPDYSGIQTKLETLLKGGHIDDVLSLGRELITVGTEQVGMSDDDGETAMEIGSCMPVIITALDKSSLAAVDKLNWALDVVLGDSYDLCEEFADYLGRKHSKSAWNVLADQLLGRLKGLKSNKSDDGFSWRYERDQLSNWAIHALENAGRKDEIVPLCEVEARTTASYERLVRMLMAENRHADAESWILEGIQATKERWSGIAANLRSKLQEIRRSQKNWPVVAAMRIEEFVRRPSENSYRECKQSAEKVKLWAEVRRHLLSYLEKGELPWQQKGWPLPESGLEQPGADQRNRFPLIGDLIEIAILEKAPDQVLRWYDQQPKSRYGISIMDDNSIAAAVETYAPDRAVAIWKKMAERLIAQVRPSAYREAATYLRKAAKVMNREKKTAEWEMYLQTLRQEHHRKRRLIEILDGLDSRPILNQRR